MLGYVFVCGYVYVLLVLLVAMLPVLGRLELSILFFYAHMTLQNTCINLKPGDGGLYSLIMLLHYWDTRFTWVTIVAFYHKVKFLIAPITLVERYGRFEQSFMIS